MRALSRKAGNCLAQAANGPDLAVLVVIGASALWFDALTRRHRKPRRIESLPTAGDSGIFWRSKAGGSRRTCGRATFWRPRPARRRSTPRRTPNGSPACTTSRSRIITPTTLSLAIQPCWCIIAGVWVSSLILRHRSVGKEEVRCQEAR